MRNLKDADGTTIPAPPGFALYRDEILTRHPGDREAAAPTSSQIFNDAPAGRDRRAATSTSPGTSPSRATQQHHRADAARSATTRSPSSATRPRATGSMQGHAPDFTITDVKTVDEPRPTRPRPAVTGATPSERPRGHRDLPGAVLPRPDRLPAGLQVQPRRRRPAACRRPGNFYTARFTCNIPRSAVTETAPGRLRRRPPGPPLDVRARPVRRRHRGPHDQRPPARQRRTA